MVSTPSGLTASPAPPAYQPADTGVKTFALTMLVFGLAGGGGYWLASRSMTDWTPALIGWGLPLIGYAFAVYRGLGLDDRRARKVIAWLRREGLNVQSPPNYEAKASLMARLPHLSRWYDFEEGRPGVRWIATSADGRTTLFEHIVVIGSGDEAEVHAKSTVVREGVRDDLVLSMHRADGRRRERLLAQTLQRIRAGDRAFDDRWVVTGDPASAKLVLTPEVRAALEGAPDGEAWVLAGGTLALCYQGYADMHGYTAMRRRSEIVWSAITKATSGAGAKTAPTGLVLP